MIQKGSYRIVRDKAGLLVIDVQERLLPAISGREAVVQNTIRLIRGASILRLPVFATEQYRKGLGSTVPEVAALLTSPPPIEKITFSACGAEGLLASLKEKNIYDAIVCGIEAHVCVCQTALELLDNGFRVFVVADAIASRTAENHRLAVERMRDAGCIIVSTEMLLFELLERAGTEEFKQILALVK
jgi:nicotinamidase-related amidase